MNHPTIKPDSCVIDRHERLQLACFAKDNEAVLLNTIWNNNYKALVFYAAGIVKDNLVAEDITAETFVKLWRQLSNFNNMPSIRAFLYKTARNACIDHLRSQEFRNRVHDDILHTSDFEKVVNGSDYDLMYGEYIQQLHLEIKQLPDACRKVFELNFLHGLSIRAIAARLGLAEQTVRNQRAKAKRLLSSAILKQKMS